MAPAASSCLRRDAKACFAGSTGAIWATVSPL